MSLSPAAGQRDPQLAQPVPQTKADVLQKVHEAVRESARHPSQWFGKKYLVLRDDGKNGQRLEVDTLTWKEWITSKFTTTGANLQNIAKSFFYEFLIF